MERQQILYQMRETTPGYLAILEVYHTIFKEMEFAAVKLRSKAFSS